MVEDMTLSSRIRQKSDSYKRQSDLDMKFDEVSVKCKKLVDGNGGTSRGILHKEKKPTKMLVSRGRLFRETTRIYYYIMCIHNIM